MAPNTTTIPTHSPCVKCTLAALCHDCRSQEQQEKLQRILSIVDSDDEQVLETEDSLDFVNYERVRPFPYQRRSQTTFHSNDFYTIVHDYCLPIAALIVTVVLWFVIKMTRTSQQRITPYQTKPNWAKGKVRKASTDYFKFGGGLL